MSPPAISDKATLLDVPTPVLGETFDELSGPLVHTDFPDKKAARDWVHTISLEIHIAPESL